MAISISPSHTEVQAEFNNGNDSTSLRAMLNTVFGSAVGKLSDFGGKGLGNCTTYSPIYVNSQEANLNGRVFFAGGANVQNVQIFWDLKYTKDGIPSLWNEVGHQSISGTVSNTDYNYVHSVADGADYDCYFRVENAFGEVGGGLVTFSTPVDDPPSVPQNLTGTGSAEGSGDFSLGWDASTDSETSVDFYTIYESGAQYATTTTTGYSGNQGIQTNTYTVTATDTEGNESAESNSVDVTTTDNCLVEGTIVMLHNGELRRIEDLQIGDKVASVAVENFEDTNDTDTLYQWRSADLKRIHTSSKVVQNEQIDSEKVISLNGGLIRGTQSHTQLVQRDNRWRFLPLEDVRVGDILFHEEYGLVGIGSVYELEGEFKVRKLTLSGPTHTFFANGVLTHNVK